MRAFRWSFAAGIVVLLLAVLAGVVRQPKPCGSLPKGYAPVIAFELARTPADLAQIFGAGPSACRMEMVHTMDAANWGDLLLFMPAYGAFLALFFVGKRARGGAVLAVVAVLADVAENLFLFRLTADLDHPDAALRGLVIATAIKWVALGIVAALAARLLWQEGRRIGAGLEAPALPVAIATVIDPSRFGPLVSLVVGLSWVAVLISSYGNRAAASPSAS